MNVKEFLAKKRKFQKEMTTHGKDMLQELFLPILQTDGVVSVEWTQYTPYFNDGDACVFSVHDLFVCLEEDPDDPQWLNEDEHPAAAHLLEVWDDLDDLLEMIFGDHVEVVATLQDGKVQFSASRCSHD